MEKATRYVLIFIDVMVVGIDCICILLASLPYATLKIIGDYFSPDKNIQSLTPKLVESLRKPSIVLGIIFFLVGVFVFLWPQKAKDIIGLLLRTFNNLCRRFIKDGRTFFRDIGGARPGRIETLLLAATVICAAIIRLMLINRPIEYDEAYTFTEFARHPFRYILSTYFVPNNQVFNSILMRISYLLLGNQIWQLRLPTFIASLILIVCVFVLGRSLYNSKVGLAAAVIVSFLPTMVIRSVSARGYILVTLMTLMGFLSADYVIRKRNIFAWLFLIITCVIGFYSIPVMLFPCGLIFAWLLLAGLSKEISKEYLHLLNWIKYLVVAGVAILILTLIFYSPILLTNNLYEIYTNNRVLQPATLANFVASFPATIHGVLLEWRTGLSNPIVYIILAGLCLSFLFHKKESKYLIPMQLTFIVYIVIMVLAERPAPINRIWLWIIPLLALWCAAGIVGGLQWISRKVAIRYLAIVFLAIMLFGFAVNGVYQAYVMSVLQPSSEDPAAEKVTSYLKPLLTNDSYVAVSTCSDARYWYYFDYYGIPDKVIRNRNRFFDKMFIIVYTQGNPSCGNEEMLNVFSKDGPDATFFDSNTVRVVKQIDYATIYELDPILERVQKAYPVH